MREIVFRGKNADGKWVYGYYCAFVFGNFPAEPAIVDASKLKNGKWEPVKVVPVSIGQFTGMCDASGRKVYEGDIIAPTMLSNIPPYEVIFDETEGQFAVREGYKHYHGTLANYDRMMDGYFRIVGNVYDNPGLLEVER